MKNFNFVFVLLLTLNFYAQKHKGTVYFNDGTKQKGLIKVINNDVLFKIKKNTKREIYNFTKVDSVSFYDKGLRKYEYIYLKDSLTPILAYVKIEDYLKLYKVIRKKTITKREKKQKIKFDKNNNAIVEHYKGKEYSLKQKTATFYLKKEKDTLASFFTSFRAENRKKIKDVVLNYFNDCKELTDIFKQKKYTKKDYLKIVAFYNKKCVEN